MPNEPVSNLKLAKWANFSDDELVLVLKAIRSTVTRDTQIPVSMREFSGYCKITSDIQEEVYARNQVNRKPRLEEIASTDYDPNAGSE